MFPVTDNASEIADIMVEALDAVYLGQARAEDVLPAANDAVNATFGDAAGSTGEAVTGAGLDDADVDGEMAMSDISGEIRYINWDINQFPAYEACAANFMEIYPNITVNVENIGWDDYWTCLLYTSPSPRDGLLSRMPSSA